MRWLGQEVNVSNLGSTEQSTVVYLGCCIDLVKWLCFFKMQYITPHFQMTPEIYGFQNITNFLW